MHLENVTREASESFVVVHKQYGFHGGHSSIGAFSALLMKPV
jgi:hypothetical protein